MSSISLRNQLKVFKYGLFYFKCDKTVSIVKLTNVSKVLSGTNTKPGSVVLIKYGTLKEPLEAEIIAVEDDVQKLREVETQFLCNSENLHLFEEEEEEEKEEVIQEDTVPASNSTKNNKQFKAKKPVKVQRKRKTSSKDNMASKTIQPQPKKGRKGKKTSTSDNTAAKISQPQPEKAKKGKKPATVLCRYSPGKDTSLKEKETETASSDLSDATFVVSNPASPLSSYTSQHTITPNHSIQSYNSPLSPSFHYSPLPSLPSSPLLRDGSSDLTPRLYRVQRRLIQPNPFETAIGELENRLVNYVDRKFEELFSFLHAQRHTSLPNFHATTPHTMPPQTATQSNINVHEQHFQTQQHHFPQVHTHTSTATEDSVSVSSPDNLGLTTENLIQIRNHASSKMNFAVRLVREVFESRELLGRNVEGVRGKQALDPIRIHKIKKLIMQFYPVPPMEQESAWRDCRKAIDSFLRKKKSPQ